MAPVHKGVAPVGVFYVPLGLLGLVAVDVAYDIPHLRDVILRVVGLILFEDLDDPAAGLVAPGIATTVLLAEGLGHIISVP